MSVTSAQGFRASGVAAGLKASGRPDVALVVNDGPLEVAAGVFTSNRVKAAPVLWSQQVVTDGELRAVALNSGGANACTGPDGFADTHRSAESVAALLGIGAGEVAVCSTGLIGERLPMGKLLDGFDQAARTLSTDGGDAAAVAIMTTDTVPKTAAITANGFVVGGMAKGAGMLAPGMATMLSTITTDAVISAELADSALIAAVATTFDRVDSDGCMSTNDTVLLLASGASGVEPSEADFKVALTTVCARLARALVADAEGASKEIQIDVVGAPSDADATRAARSVARSNLFKCAMYGEDPNWGRVISAVGATSVEFDPNLIDVQINGAQVCRGGAAGADRSTVDLTGRVITVVIDLHAGSSTSTVWTNDLTAAYVHENSAYST
ncbi:MAG: bifunctional glutamate N-acetyltransferase/amino-acid acetyltransferase ArgJ [Candidatus Nanopelagicales bacterium]